jgi:hypothetical protein
MIISLPVDKGEEEDSDAEVNSKKGRFKIGS